MLSFFGGSVSPKKETTDGRSRTSNLLVRSQTPYPLGHDGKTFENASFCYMKL
jgi:hypothetical protein